MTNSVISAYSDAIVEALQRDDIALAKELRRAGDFKPNEDAYGNALVEASQQNDTKLIKALLGAGADVHWKYDRPIRYALTRGRQDNSEAVKVLSEAGANMFVDRGNVFIDAASRGRTETVKVWLEVTTDTDEKRAVVEKALAFTIGERRKDTEEVLREWISQHPTPLKPGPKVKEGHRFES